MTRALKLLAMLSYRAASLRLSFSQPNIHSIALRCLYLERSNSLGSPSFGLRFVLRRAMTGPIR